MKTLSLGAWIALAACGGSSSGSLDSLGGDLGKAQCKKMFQCCTADEIMQQFMDITLNMKPITTEGQCEELYGGLFAAFATADYKASLKAGRIDYDEAAAQACLAALNAASCAEYNGTQDTNTACPPFIIPLVDVGGGCTQDYECTSNHCVGATVQPSGPSTDGACQALPTQGQPCTFDCVKGFYCTFDSTQQMELCKPLEADGTACTSDRECQSDNCPTTSGSGTCMAKPPMCTGG